LRLGGPRPRTLLAALLLAANRTVSAERLIDAVWGESPPPSAGHALSVYVSALRKTFGDGNLRREASGYVLKVDPQRLDAIRFEALLALGQRQLEQGRAARAAETLREALALWRGPALGDLAFLEFARLEAERLEELRLVAQEARIEAELALGRHEQLVAELEPLVAEHPLRERSCAQLMLSLYRSRRQTDALRVYRETREQLVETVGLEPGPELRRLQQAILNHDPALDLHPRRERAGFLPAQVTTFVGREQELPEVRELLEREDVRLVTLTGPGGVGKTRLALAAAEALAADYPDGAWFVDLAPLRDTHLLADAVAQVLGSRVELSRHIGNRRLLLLLDNLEQLLAATPEIGTLLKACPNLRVLATSRERLRLSGEHIYCVPPLRQANAIALFTDRACAVRQGYEPDAATTAICKRLDGLPLALELAAARLADLSPEELLGQLDTRVPALADGPRDAPARQQTIRATIDWSHDLLTGDEQRLFARLAVFSGGCTEAAAGEVCDASPAALRALVDKNLLRRDGERLLLLETIREYGLEHLGTGAEADALRLRHAEWCAGLLEQAWPELKEGDQQLWLARLEDERDNVRTALDWSHGGGRYDLELRMAARAGRFWYMQSDLTEGRRRLEQALEHADSDVSLAGWLLHYLALLAIDQGDFGVGERLTGQLLGLAGQLDAHQRADALSVRAIALHARGDLAGAADFHERALALGRELGYVWLVGVTLHNLGAYWLEAGDLDRAKSLFEEALALEGQPDQHLTAAACSNLAWLAAQTGDLLEARARSLKTLAIVSRMGLRHWPVASATLVSSAWVAATGGDGEAALQLLGAVDRLLDELRCSLWPSIEPFRQEVAATARGLLAAEGEGVPSGEALSLESAVAYALERLRR
jgi:predicted ATPase/DNA-binding SARP family transcriptional activator